MDDKSEPTPDEIDRAVIESPEFRQILKDVLEDEAKGILIPLKSRGDIRAWLDSLDGEEEERDH